MCTLSPFEKKWIKCFANDISKQDLKNYVTNGGYIWHVFSWKLKPDGSYLCGNQARQAFDAENKCGAQYYEPFHDNGLYMPENKVPSAVDLDKLTECYVMSSDAKWTYIKTHENDSCGPYFYKP